MNYDKVKINTADIMTKLHDVAVEQAKSVNDNFTLINSLLVGNGDDGQYTPHIIVTKKDNEIFKEDEKDIVLKYIQEYVKYFVGGNQFERIRPQDLNPVFDKKTRTAKKTVTKGYCVNYTVIIDSKEVNSLPSKATQANSLMSGLLADIANLQIKNVATGETYGIGKAFNTAIRAVTKTPINITDVDNHIQNIIANDFPQSKPNIRVYDIKSLSNKLQKNGWWKPEYLDKFKGCEYAVTIEVTEADEAFEDYTKKKVAEICTRAFGDATKLVKINRNKVEEEDVIEIDEYSSEYKTRSAYDRRYDRSSGSSSSISENTMFLVPNVRIVVENIVGMLFEKTTTPISVDFVVKDPTKENTLEHSVGVLSAMPHTFKKEDLPEVSHYEGYEFKYWNPDPNEFEENYEKKDKSGKIIQIPNKTEAVFIKQDDSKQQGKVLFIIPHKALTSKNRKDKYEYANDGTVRTSISDEPYKSADFVK